MVSRESLPSFKKCSARNPDEDITKKFDTFLPDGTNTEVDKEDIIKGYRYGTDLVPFTDDDMANMKFKCDVREFSVIGFTKSSNIKRHYFAGKDTMMIAAKKNNEEAAVALSALCTALKETETVGIVRKVYSARSSPTIGALIPVTDAEVEYLVFIELPFIEDMRELEFPSLAVEPSTSSKSAPSQQQLDAVDSLIDAMDMSAQPEDDDSVVPCKMKNPTLQRLYQVLAARALDDTCHIPELSPMISNIVNSTAYSCRWIDRDQEEFSKLFTLETAAKTAKKNNDNVYKDSGVAPSKVDEKGDGAGFDSTNLRDLNQEEITEIGTIDPARDFDQMLRSPKLAIKAYTGMTERILQFITETVGSSLYEKALRCIKKLRAAAVKSNDQELLEIVNHFFSSMKSLLLNKGPKDFWAELIEEKITPIDKDEASNSDVSAADKNSYLSEIEKVSAPAEPEPMEDADDMLDMI
ncbi:XRCC5 [Bugula neritina]|uniref:XRCC5 n=1 Tax=Bugula neritina TaxID=10212 RepID=A0A7J7J5S2_BUGNE|nr:XRCC5 [Bugula neritina]